MPSPVFKPLPEPEDEFTPLPEPGGDSVFTPLPEPSGPSMRARPESGPPTSFADYLGRTAGYPKAIARGVAEGLKGGVDSSVIGLFADKFLTPQETPQQAAAYEAVKQREAETAKAFETPGQARLATTGAVAGGLASGLAIDSLVGAAAAPAVAAAPLGAPLLSAVGKLGIGMGIGEAARQGAKSESLGETAWRVPYGAAKGLTLAKAMSIAGNGTLLKSTLKQIPLATGLSAWDAFEEKRMPTLAEVGGNLLTFGVINTLFHAAGKVGRKPVAPPEPPPKEGIQFAHAASPDAPAFATFDRSKAKTGEGAKIVGRTGNDLQSELGPNVFEVAPDGAHQQGVDFYHTLVGKEGAPKHEVTGRLEIKPEEVLAREEAVPPETRARLSENGVTLPEGATGKEAFDAVREAAGGSAEGMRDIYTKSGVKALAQSAEETMGQSRKLILLDETAAKDLKHDFGPGAASAKEFQPVKAFVTGIKNAQIDKEREARGAAPIMKGLAEEHASVWAEASRRIEDNATYPETLLNDLAKSPRNANAVEVAVLDRHLADLKNEYNKATKNYIDATERQDADGAARHGSIRASLEGSLQKLEKVSRETGAIWGRSGRMRQRMIKEDYSLDAMVLEKRAQKEGQPLTPEEDAAVRKAYSKIKTAEEKLEAAQGAAKTRYEKQIADYKDRIARGDYSVKKPKPLVLDAETFKLKQEADALKAEWQAGKERAAFGKLTPIRKGAHAAAFVLNNLKAIRTSWDLSAFGRQGMIATLAHPIRGAKSFREALRATRSEHGVYLVEQKIKNHPLFSKAIEAKVFFSPMETSSTPGKAMEEVYRGGEFAAKYAPGVRASERAYTANLNYLRMQQFEALYSSSEGGWLNRMIDKAIGRKPLSDAELKGIGNMVNIANGRGDMGKFAVAAEAAANILWSPRLLLSRFQYLLGQPAWKAGGRRARVAIAAEYARMAAGLLVFYALGKAAGATLEEDPRSSDFGKLKFGTVRVDPMAGLSQVYVLLARTRTGEAKRGGKIIPLRGENVPNGQGLGKVWFNFVRSKLTPGLGTFADVTLQNTVVNPKGPVTLSYVATNQLPMAPIDLYQSLMKHGMDSKSALMLLTIFGLGIQDYEDKHPASGKKLGGSK